MEIYRKGIEVIIMYWNQNDPTQTTSAQTSWVLVKKAEKECILCRQS